MSSKVCLPRSNFVFCLFTWLLLLSPVLFSLSFSSVDKLRANCQVFLSFGSEAMLSLLEWSLLCVAHHQHYQALIADEIRRVVGSDRVLHFDDQIRMPFTVAFLNEVLRWKTVLPLNFTRRFVCSFSICVNLSSTLLFMFAEPPKMEQSWATSFRRTRWCWSTFGPCTTIPTFGRIRPSSILIASCSTTNNS